MNLEDYSKYYIQGSDHYLIPKDVFKELFNEMLNWKEESIELKKKYENAVADYETTMAEKNKLKKQLENKYKKVGTLTSELLYEENTKLINQQKEFINYLEDEIKLYKNDIQNFIKDYNIYFSLINDLRVSKAKIEEILKKYKSIIGDDK